MTQTISKQDRWPNVIGKHLVRSDWLVLYLTVLLILVALPLTTNFLTIGNARNLLSNYWPLLLAVLGQTFVLLTAGIDLSQVGIIATSNVLASLLITEKVNAALLEGSPFWGVLVNENGGVLSGTGVSALIAWVAVFLSGAAIGWVNGTAVSRWGMPAFMVTLVTMLFFNAFAVWSTQSENIQGLPSGYRDFSNLWVATAVGLMGLAVSAVVLRRTVFGRRIYAVGRNPRASQMAGVPVRQVLTRVYIISGMFAAAAAALYSTRLGAGRPTLGSDLLLDIIGAAVIGGISLFGGRGSIKGAALGTLFYVVLTNILNLAGLSFYTVMAVKGIVILFAVSLDMFRTQISSRLIADE